ncbi:hypothetical protein MKW94_013009 [Papaver nudicaule]|uniref:Uncharacterized protein n=1 Tax=Papaver nudicaule TaxID=74823 RepID=A0AA41UWT3_PAPNU|nr:hypothetical protein [Papaver nudicaule]
MDNLSLGKTNETPMVEPQRPLFNPAGPFDVRSTFVCTLRLSAKQLYKRLNEKFPPRDDRLNVVLSNSQISISSLVFKNIYVMVQTNEPISFSICHRTLRYCLRMMRTGKEIHRILFSYQPEKNNLALADGQTKLSIKTRPCTEIETS